MTLITPTMWKISKAFYNHCSSPFYRIHSSGCRRISLIYNAWLIQAYCNLSSICLTYDKKCLIIISLHNFFSHQAHLCRSLFNRIASFISRLWMHRMLTMIKKKYRRPISKCTVIGNMCTCMVFITKRSRQCFCVRIEGFTHYRKTHNGMFGSV